MIVIVRVRLEPIKAFNKRSKVYSGLQLLNDYQSNQENDRHKTTSICNSHHKCGHIPLRDLEGVVHLDVESYIGVSSPLAIRDLRYSGIVNAGLNIGCPLLFTKEWRVV